MFDVWVGDVNIFAASMLLAAVAVLPIQLVLCFKVKSFVIRLIPAILFAIIGAALLIEAFTSGGWERIGYLLFAIYVGILLLACGIGWAIWGISQLFKALEKLE